MALWFRKRPKIRELRIELEQLEQRIVLDASVDAIAQPDNPDSENSPDPQGSDQGGENPASQGQTPEPEQTANDPLTDLFDQSLDVVLISDAVEEIGAIKAAADDSAIVMSYDAESDSIGDIVDRLEAIVSEDGNRIEQLAILSHGDPGFLEISELSVISGKNILENEAVWQRLGTLLADDARIDLYGCEIGKTEQGRALVENMASTTSATVWASDDITGKDDWDLEVRSSGDSRDYLLDHSMLAGVGLELGVVAFVNGSFETGDYTGWNLKDYDGVDPSVDSGAYYFGITSILNTGTEVQFGDSIHDYADGIDVYVYPGGNTTYNATDGSKLAAQLSNGPYHTFISQDLSLSQGVTKVLWDMSYTNYESDFSNTQFISVSIIPQTGDPEVLFKTNPGDPLTSSMQSHWSNISKFNGQDVTFQIEILGNEFFLDASFDNFRLDTNKPPTAIDQTKPGFEDEAMVIALGGNDGDPDLDQGLTFFIDSLPSNGDLYATESDAVSGANPLAVGDSLADNSVWYITDPNDHTDSSFTFHVQDDGGAANPGEDTSALATVDLAIEPVNDPPIAVDGSVTVSGKTLVTLYGYDADRPAVTEVDFDYPNNTAHGKVKAVNGETIQTDGQGNYTLVVEYDPDNGYTGTDEIHFTFSSPGGPWQGFETGNGTRFGYNDNNITFDMEVGDLNQDGYDDIVMAIDGRNGFYLNDGAGGFSVRPIGSPWDTERSCVTQLGDLNGDGYLDAAFRNENVADKIYFWDQASLNFRLASTLANSSDGGMGSIGMGDVDGDGDLDIAVAKNSGDSMLYINDGSGGFDSGTVLETGSGTVSTMDMGDVDGDGYADIVIGKYQYYDALLLSDGDGYFDELITLTSPDGSARNAQYIDLGDVDGDGDVDIVVANDGSWSRNREIFYRNDDNQGFTAFDIGTGGDYSGGVRLADVDLDGDLDALVSNFRGSNNLYYLFDSSTGQFGSGVAIGNQFETFGMEVIDYDNDGDMDFIGSSGSWYDHGARERVFENLGFAPAISDPGVITVTVTNTSAMTLSGASTSTSASSPTGSTLNSTSVAGSPTSTTGLTDFSTGSDLLGGVFSTTTTDFDLLDKLTPVSIGGNNV